VSKHPRLYLEALEVTEKRVEKREIPPAGASDDKNEKRAGGHTVGKARSAGGDWERQNPFTRWKKKQTNSGIMDQKKTTKKQVTRRWKSGEEAITFSIAGLVRAAEEALTKGKLTGIPIFRRMLTSAVKQRRWTRARWSRGKSRRKNDGSAKTIIYKGGRWLG